MIKILLGIILAKIFPSVSNKFMILFNYFVSLILKPYYQIISDSALADSNRLCEEYKKLEKDDPNNRIQAVGNTWSLMHKISSDNFKKLEIHKNRILKFNYKIGSIKRAIINYFKVLYNNYKKPL